MEIEVLVVVEVAEIVVVEAKPEVTK